MHQARLPDAHQRIGLDDEPGTALLHAAYDVADEAATLVMESGASHGQAYYHDPGAIPPGQPVIGWALTDQET